MASKDVKKELSAKDRERFDMAVADLEGESMHTIVGQDPTKSYFLASKNPNHPQGVERMKHLGYEVVNRENSRGEYMPRGVVHSGDEGAVQTPELVLMCIDKELAEYRDRRIAEISMERRQAIDDKMQEAIEEARGNGNKTIFIMGS